MIPNYRRGDSKLRKSSIDDALNGLKTAVSTKSSMFGSYASGVRDSTDVNSAELSINQFTKSLDNTVSKLPTPTINSVFQPKPASSYKKPNLRRGKDKGLIPSLIDIIVSVIQIPTRFDKMYAGLTNSGLSLTHSVEAIGKSAYLGMKDIALLVVAIVKVVIKYWKCILSLFVTTTVGGCFIFHPITFLCYMLYLIFPLSAYFVWIFTGFDLMPYIDLMFEEIDRGDDRVAEVIGFNLTKWPKAVRRWCYTCFFEEVKLKDVLKDVMVVKDIGDMITYDFQHKMPIYFRPANRYGVVAKRNFDALFGM